MQLIVGMEKEKKKKDSENKAYVGQDESEEDPIMLMFTT